MNQMDRVTDPADPNRCKGTSRYGQCPYLKEHGSDYCKACCGVSTKNNEEIRSYLLAQAEYKSRLAQLDAQQEPIRDLHHAITITRELMGKLYARITDDASLMSSCAPLEKMIGRMESLSKSLVGLEEKLDTLLPRQTVLQLGQTIVNILIGELHNLEGHEEVVERIMSRIFGIINSPPKQLEAPNV